MRALHLSTERLRQLRREYEQGGLEALRPGKSRGPRRLSERDVARLERLFARGIRPREAHEQLKVASLSTISRAYRAWRARRSEERAASSAPIGSAESRTVTLPRIEMLPRRAAISKLRRPRRPQASSTRFGAAPSFSISARGCSSPWSLGSGSTRPPRRSPSTGRRSRSFASASTPRSPRSPSASVRSKACADFVRPRPSSSSSRRPFRPPTRSAR
jgi:hypothetical protein